MEMTQSFKAGTVANAIKIKDSTVSSPVFGSVTLSYPARLNAMAIDPGRIAPRTDRIYTAGEVVFSISLFTKVKVEATADGEIRIDDNCKRKALILHAALMMKKALKFENGLRISAQVENDIKHAGLGSSGSLIAAVACAINELYGNPVQRESLIRYLAQNHGEEINGVEDQLVPVQCIGGSAASGLTPGGLKVIAGESTVIAAAIIPASYKAVIGIPSDYSVPDSKVALEEEERSMSGFLNTGERFGPAIAYNIVHKLLPAAARGDLAAVGDVIFDYRYNMGSIRNCSFLYPKLVELSTNLAHLKTDGMADVVSVSSVGPGIFAITQRPEECRRVFETQGLTTYIAAIENNGYKVISRSPLQSCEAEDMFWNGSGIISEFSQMKPSKFVDQRLRSPQPSRRLLDIGCGAARNAALAASLGYDTFAVDRSPRMLEIAKGKMRAFYPEEELLIRIVRGSMTDLPFESGFFDTALAIGVFHQAHSETELRLAVKEAARVIRHNGTLVMEVFTSEFIDEGVEKVDGGLFVTQEGLHMTLLTSEKIKAILEEYGFTAISTETEIKPLSTGKRHIFKGSFAKNRLDGFRRD